MVTGSIQSFGIACLRPYSVLLLLLRELLPPVQEALEQPPLSRNRADYPFLVCC